MSDQVVLYEKGSITPANKKKLEQAGFVLVVVKNIEKVKISTPPAPATPEEEPENDGFRLNHAT